MSFPINDFNAAATELFERADRLSTYGQEIEERLKDAIATETSNQTRAKQDVEREGARLKTLEERYEKLKAAVDEARGGPTEDLVGLIPDKEELSSLVDVGAADAAAPQVAIAKKSIKLAVEQIKKILLLVDKTMKFAQLTEIRDEVFNAVTAQRRVVEAAQERLRMENVTLTVLDTVKTAGASMTSLAAETNKLATAFISFATTLRDLNNQPVTADTLEKIVNDMEFYVEQARGARNKVILT